MTKPTFRFTFQNIGYEYEQAINNGYRVLTCRDYALQRKEKPITEKVLINRIDIDFSVKKAERLGDIFKRLGINGTFFVRLHAPEYNPFAFENYRILKALLEAGHEIGYHSEIIDQSEIWKETAEENLIRDIEIMNQMFNSNISGVASHGGMTGANNLHFWKNRKAEEFGLLYEAYDWFNKVFYVSDSEWTCWKCYRNGKRIEEDMRSLGEHSKDGHEIIYLLIHSDTFFDRHFYE